MSIILVVVASVVDQTQGIHLLAVEPHLEDRMLQLKYPQHRDSGIYDCQVSSRPHISKLIKLDVAGKCRKAEGCHLKINSRRCYYLNCRAFD